MSKKRTETIAKPFGFVIAALGVCALIAWAYLGATPRLSDLPEHEPAVEGSVACEDLDAWTVRVRERGYSHRLHVLARVQRRRRDHAVFLVCGDRARQIHEADGLQGTPDGVSLRILADGRVVGPNVGTGSIMPRYDGRKSHEVGLGFGVLGWLLLVAAWVSRPYNALRDMFPAAPSSAHFLSPPSNDRLRVSVGEGAPVELRDRVLVPDDEVGLRPGEAQGPHIELPGVGGGYREGAGGPPVVVGPALLNGLPVRTGERAPIADGDRLYFTGGLLLRLELPAPGRVVRYLVRDGSLRGVHRVRDLRTSIRLLGAVTVGLAAMAILHLDIAARVPLTVGLGVLAVFLLLRVPAGLAQRLERFAPLERADDLEVSTDPEEGWSLRLDDQPFARLPALAEHRDPDLRHLQACIDEELRLLSESS